MDHQFAAQDRENPVLLLLHGGPGVATSPYPRDVLFSWTKDFTFVQWDHRRIFCG